MPNYRRANATGACYFFTVVTFKLRPILLDDDVRAALREGTQLAQQQYPFIINAWVLLPDHLHCAWTLPEGDANFAQRWITIKQHVTRACHERLHQPAWLTPSQQKRNESTIWQRRYWEHQIRDDFDFQRHIDYMYWNPVKHGLVDHVADWPYSTFHRDVKQGIYPNNWGGVKDENGLFGE